MKKNNYERPYLIISEMQADDIYCNEINISAGNIIIDGGEDGLDNW